MTKISFSLSDQNVAKVLSSVKTMGVKASSVVEAALIEFFSSDPEVQRKAAQAADRNKKTRSAGAWRATFWRLLDHEFDRTPQGSQNNQYAPRLYGVVTVVFLLSDDPLYVHAFDDPTMRFGQPGAEVTVPYRVADDVLDAVRKTAAWIRETTNLVDKRRAKLDPFFDAQ